MLGIAQIKTTGERIDLGRKHLSLEEAQALVATGTKRSLIELVSLPHNDPDKVGNRIMYVHEEGLLESLPLNYSASAIAQQPLVGDVILVENEPSDFADEDENEEEAHEVA